MSWATSGDGSSPLIKDPAAELVAFGGTGAAGVGAARACKSWECKRDIGAGQGLLQEGALARRAGRPIGK